MKGKNELCKRRAGVTASAKHYDTTQLIPHKRTCHNRFIHWPCVPTGCKFHTDPNHSVRLLSTAAFPALQTPRGAVSDRDEEINCSSCIGTCRDTLLPSCILLLPRRNRCEDGYVYSKEWSEPASAACHWWM